MTAPRVDPVTGNWGPLQVPIPKSAPAGIYDAGVIHCEASDGSAHIETDYGYTNFTIGPGTGSGGTSPGKVYLALGDSYSSGEGNPPFDSGPAAPCDRSDQAWPHLVGKELGVARTVLRACSGATSLAIDKAYLGQAPQIDDVRNTKADVVTMTFGGNDAYFAPIFGYCYGGDLIDQNPYLKINPFCTSALITSKAVVAGKSLFWAQRFSEVVKSAKTANPSSTVYVVGYPHLFPGSDAALVRCGWLKAGQRAQFNDLADQLNSSLARAATAAGATFVSTSDAFAGHELCTDQSDINPLTPTRSLTDLRGEAHPNYRGQDALAARIKPQLK